MLSIVFLLLAAASPETVQVDRNTLSIWSDGNGHYVAAAPKLEHVYYGDGKTLFESTAYSWSSNGNISEATLRDQRYDRQSQTEVATDAEGNLTIACGKRVTKMVPVAPDKAKPMLEKAAFSRSPHAFRAYALARDDKGNYYYVDRGRYPENERAFRVFMGPRGNMKEQKLSNIVHDSAGDIFATPTGDLRLIVGEPMISEWVRNDAHVKLLDLPLEDNLTMIYNELGVYKKLRLGTPCDDL